MGTSWHRSRRRDEYGDAAGARGRAPASKALRADAQRNREALLEAAAAAFTEHGTDASLEDVAKRAGVGIGTLYRHFPTRDALVEAAYRRGVETLCDQADQLLATQPPAGRSSVDAGFVGYVATKRGLGRHAQAGRRPQRRSCSPTCTARVRAAIGHWSIGRRGQRRDPRRRRRRPTCSRAIGGVCMASDAAGWQDQARRLVGLLMDGLRYGAPTR